MQSLIGIDKIVIKDYSHMTIINDIVYWMKLTHLMSRFSQNLWDFFWFIYIYF